MSKNSYWPDIAIEDILLPEDVLQDAKNEWEAESGGAMSLKIERSPTAADAVVVIAVHAMHLHTKTTVWLFSLAYHEQAPYPVVYSNSIDVDNRIYERAKLRSAEDFEPDEIDQEYGILREPLDFVAAIRNELRSGRVRSIITNLVAVGRVSRKQT